MRSSRLPVARRNARPWTPPDIDSYTDKKPLNEADETDARDESQSDSGYFGDDADDDMRKLSDVAGDPWLLPATSNPVTRTPSPVVRTPPPEASAHNDAAKNYTFAQRPRTPPTQADNKHNAHNAPQYPYTPDSTRMPLPRTQSYESSSPVPLRSWDSSPSLRPVQTSPVQKALFSYLNNLERLMATHQPEAEQMEYIIAQFEAMTAYLSAPESQSKKSDDHLFAELDAPAITNGDKPNVLTREEGEAYVAEVGKYIAGVQEHVRKMRARLEEVRQVNETSLEIISDLRRQLAEEKARRPRIRYQRRIIRVEPQRGVIWAAFTEALDKVSEMLYEW